MNSTRKYLSIFVMLIGLGVIFTAWLTNLSGSALWNSTVVGVLLFIFAGIRGWGVESETIWASWFSMILSVWLIISPFLFNFTDVTIASIGIGISGFLALIFSGWSSSIGSSRGSPLHQ